MIQIGAYAINKTLVEIKKYQEKMKEYEKDDVMVCKYNLEIAKKAINGISKEAQELFLELDDIDFNRPKDVNRINRRLKEYLEVNKLKIKLEESAGSLKGVRSALQEHSERFLIWPWVKENRKEAMADFSETLGKLDGYIINLQDLYYITRSGLWVKQLSYIQDLIKNKEHNDDLKKEIKDYIKITEPVRSEGEKIWMETVNNFSATCEILRTSFR